MTIRAWLPSLAVIGLALTCGLRIEQSEAADAQGAAASPGAGRAGHAPCLPPVDPIAALIDTSQQHFDAGERELKVGHLDRARSEFDRAARRPARVAVRRADRRPPARAFRPPGRPDQCPRDDGARPGRRLRREEGRTGSIDELLKIATFPKPAGRRRDGGGRQGGPGSHRARHPDPAELAHLRVRRAVPGPAARLHPGEPDARDEVPADDPERLQGRGPAARPRLHPDHRERLQDQRAVEGQREGSVAVHEGHGGRARPEARLVRRRAVGSREGDASRRRST